MVFLSVSSSSDLSASDCGSVAKGEKGLLVKSGLEDRDVAERSSHPSTTSCVDGQGSWESGGLAMEGKHSVMGLDPQSALVFALVFLPGLVGVPPSERVVFLVESAMDG